MSLVAWYPLNGDLKDNCGRYNLITKYIYGDINRNWYNNTRRCRFN